MNTVVRNGMPLALTLLLPACATKEVPTPDRLASLAQKTENASHQLPASRLAYNESILQLVQSIERSDPNAAFDQLRHANVTVSLPKVSRPLHHLEVPDKAVPSATAVGVPVVLGYATEPDSLYPPEGLFVDATAVVRRTNGRTSLEFVTKDLIRIEDQLQPVAVDPAGASQHLAKRARKLAKSGFLSMIRPSSTQRKPQIYLLDPYDPAKIPLLMVHGLQSTPVAFAQLVSALRADPEIRKKYQLWQFYYPSGSPVLANAADLRDSLDRTLRELNPDHSANARHGFVVLGHSMGGVISHTLVSSSGDQVWQSVFSQPAEKLHGDPAAIQSLERILKFQARSDANRVIFMAAPHRGSPMADSFIGWIGNSMARLAPMAETGFSQLARDNPQAMRPDAASFYAAGRFSAVRTLSAKSPALIALAGLPIRIPYHSIIGQQRPGPVALGSDGVVPYASSHLDGATSELVVRSGHGVIGNPDGIQEVIRILKEAK